MALILPNQNARHFSNCIKSESEPNDTENRCLVPANSFAEYAPGPNPETKKKHVVWFALNESRPLFCFAGIWTEFNGNRGTKSKPIPGPHLVYGFLTTSPNSVVEPIHPRAMPVILTTRGTILPLASPIKRQPWRSLRCSSRSAIPARNARRRTRRPYRLAFESSV
jgi:SOS response associated peptidase (SRAP)